MQCEHFTDSLIYQMVQLTAYCHEQGEQYLKAINAGLTLDQFAVLDVLTQNKGLCQMDLAKIILRDRVYTSRILSTLEEKNLIERKLETKGKRLVKGLYLTIDGEEIYAELKCEIDEKFSKVFEEITDEEYSIISQGIQKMKDAISKYTIMPL